MATGTIQNASQLNLAHMTPQQVEASATNMRLLALIVLTNNVRPDSKETIAHLQNGYACTSASIAAGASCSIAQSSRCTRLLFLCVLCNILGYSGDVHTPLQPMTTTRAHCCRPAAMQVPTAQPVGSHSMCKPLTMKNVHAAVSACRCAVAVGDVARGSLKTIFQSPWHHTP